MLFGSLFAGEVQKLSLAVGELQIRTVVEIVFDPYYIAAFVSVKAALVCYDYLIVTLSAIANRPSDAPYIEKS